jgi:hypothetical protein
MCVYIFKASWKLGIQNKTPECCWVQEGYKQIPWLLDIKDHTDLQKLEMHLRIKWHANVQNSYRNKAAYQTLISLHLTG